MEHTLHRLIQGGILARRGDAAWIRRAMLGGQRHDLESSVTSVAGPVLTDRTQAWEANVYGALTTAGHNRPGCRLRVTSGDAAGETWSITTTAGTQLTASGDLEAAGVAPGDAYVIERPEDDEAIEWFAAVDIRTVLQHPGDHRLFPCYAVVRGPVSQQGTPIGHLRERRRTAAGPVTDVLRFLEHVTLNVVSYAIQPEEALWMDRALTQLFRDSIRFFDRLIDEGNASLQSGPLQMIQGKDLPAPAFTIESTLTATREALGFATPSWLIDQAVNVNAVPREQGP